MRSPAAGASRSRWWEAGAQCLAVDPADPETVYAGLRGGGVRRTTDGGRTWADCGLPAPDVFSLAVSPAGGVVYAGTEPSALYRSDDRGETWRELSALLELPSQPTWSFPPRPWTSHVRWIAPSPHDGDVVLAGIELGGLMRSTDGGETWEDHRPGAQRDVHSLAWHPRVEGFAYEAGGGGTARSVDWGESWQPADEGRDRHYTWSVAVDPEDPELWYVSASTGPFKAHRPGNPEAHVYRRENGSWHPLAGVFPTRYRPCPMRSLRSRAVCLRDLPTARSGRAATAATRGCRPGSTETSSPASWLSSGPASAACNRRHRACPSAEVEAPIGRATSR